MAEQENTGKKLSLDQALVKAQKYCAYQERSQQEVRDKLYTFGLHKNQVEELISRLISDGFLKEERFAIAYATGKFRTKKWGVIKIRQGLKEKKISEPLIVLAINEIDPHEYLAVLQKLIRQKLKTVKEKNVFKRNYKLAQYCISHGFETELVWEVLRSENEA